MSNDMNISIITPTYNSARFIQDTYKSISRQTHTNWEWLVTDDCSSDETLSILLEIAEQDPRVKVHKLDINSGAAVARNYSLSRVSGDFIAFLDSDDLWVPAKLETQLDFMQQNRGINFSFTAYCLINEDGISLNKVIDSSHKQTSFGYEDMLRKNATLGCSTVMLRTAGFNVIQMPLIRTGQDYALWLSLLRTGEKAHLITTPLTKYRICQNSISRNKFKKCKRQWKIYVEIERVNIFKASLLFFLYALHAVFRR